MTLILKEYLKKHGISSKELAERMQAKAEEKEDSKYKLSAVSISNILNDKSSPKVSTLEAIAETLDTSIISFFDQSIEQETPQQIADRIKRDIDKLVSDD